MDLMDENNMKQNLDSYICERKRWPTTLPLVQDLLTKIPHGLHNYLQGWKPLVKNVEKFDSTNSLMLGEKESFNTWQDDLQRQMQAWSENSCWVDQPPEIKDLMDENNMKQNLDSYICERKRWPTTLPLMQDLLTKIPHRLHNYLQGWKPLVKNVEKFDSTNSLMPGKKESFNTWQDDLQRQMQAWSENSDWVDQPPELKFSVPKGSLCELNVKFKIGLPPDAVFNVIVDPDNQRVFKNIREVISRRVLVDEGLRQVVEVEQAAIWRFLWWSGTFSVNVLVDQDRRDHMVKFKQGKSGFMKRFEGAWKVEPFFLDEGLCSPYKPESYAEYYSCSGGKGRVGSIVSLNQLIQPAIVPPPPISWYLRGITTRTTELMIQDFLVEALRLRGAVMDSASGQGIGVDYDEKIGLPTNDYTDIKGRWHRRRGKRRKNSAPSRSF